MGSTPVPHKEFDPNAFVGGEGASQELCNFILALSLAYNDFKYYILSFNGHIKSKPDGSPERNAAWGEHNGVKFHLFRLHVGFAHELFKLIDENRKLLDDPSFREIVRVMSKRPRESWQLLVEAALADASKPRRANPLYMIRNKMIFHYDAKMLFSGYQAGFFKDGETLEDACVSEGNTLEESRFYFADLAVDGCFRNELGQSKDEFLTTLRVIMGEINKALFHIVIRFIQGRGFGWRIPR